MNNFTIVAIWESKEVWFCSGYADSCYYSQTLMQHRLGYSWAFNEPATTRLAVAILLHFCTIDDTLNFYQDFADDVLAALPPNDFAMPVGFIMGWLSERKTLFEAGVI